MTKNKLVCALAWRENEGEANKNYFVNFARYGLIIRLLKPLLLVVRDADAARLLTISPFNDEMVSGYHIVDDIGMQLPVAVSPKEDNPSVFVGVIVCPCLIVHNIIDGLANALVK